MPPTKASRSVWGISRACVSTGALFVSRPSGTLLQPGGSFGDMKWKQNFCISLTHAPAFGRALPAGAVTPAVVLDAGRLPTPAIPSGIS